ncbi:MAG: hypothetical protein F6K31_11060 [Symploca sp. SIO2G7]|nr:hypothetical protein [Symploca sp. SIO2G7]
MAVKEGAQFTLYAKWKYEATGPVNPDVEKNYLRAVVAIASADGEASQKELDWFAEEQRLLGLPAEVIEENIFKYDGKNADIEQLLGNVHYDFPFNFRRAMLYQAIKMSRADGVYHDKEKAAVDQAAQILGVEPSVVASLESLVEIEESTDRLRLTIFETVRT